MGRPIGQPINRPIDRGKGFQYYQYNMIKLKNPATTTPARSRIKDQFFVFSMLFFGGVSLFTVLTNLLLGFAFHLNYKWLVIALVAFSLVYTVKKTKYVQTAQRTGVYLFTIGVWPLSWLSSTGLVSPSIVYGIFLLVMINYLTSGGERTGLNLLFLGITAGLITHYYLTPGFYSVMTPHEQYLDWIVNVPLLFGVLALLLARFERAYEEERTANLQKTRELEHLSMTDHLTGLFNRLMLEEAFIQAKGSYTRTGNAFSLLLIDIDHFKAYNDSLGHAEGDRCLQTVTGTIQSCLERDTDTAFRYGGEEFLVLLPYTDPPGSLKVAERIRRRIEELQVYHPDTSGEAILTVSIGTTTARPGKTDQDTLFQEVDAAMYTAKASGRNRVIQYHNL